MGASAGALGIVAGAGALPVVLAEHMRRSGEPYYVLRLKGMADPALAAHPGEERRIDALGGTMRAARAAGCDRLVLAGLVARPDFAALRPDLRGLAALPRIVKAAGKGDDALLRAVISEFEREGFAVVGADQILETLRAPAGAAGAVTPDEADLADIEKGRAVAAALGAHDVGQGAVVCDGLVLAVEAQEGTDRMLARVAELPGEIRGREGARKGVLVKRPKPSQERRVDLPTVGPDTVRGAARAGLKGVAFEADATLLLDRGAAVEAADAAGMFLYGFESDAEPGD